MELKAEAYGPLMEVQRRRRRRRMGRREGRLFQLALGMMLGGLVFVLLGLALDPRGSRPSSVDLEGVGIGSPAVDQMVSIAKATREANRGAGEESRSPWRDFLPTSVIGTVLIVAGLLLAGITHRRANIDM